MRCPMQTEKRAAVRTKEIGSKTEVVASVEFVVRTALHDSVEDDFVHSPLRERLLLSGKSAEKRTPGRLAPHSFSSARHSTTASAQKGSEMASLVTSQNTGNIFSTRKLAIQRKKYKMSSKW